LKCFAPAHSEGDVDLVLKFDNQVSPTINKFEFRAKQKDGGYKRIREVVREDIDGSSELNERECKVRIIERLGYLEQKLNQGSLHNLD
jgi:hypothetical protein